MDTENNFDSTPQDISPKALTEQELIRFDYIKSNAFRVIYAEGAIGGVTPRAMIHFALYNERGAIPLRTVHRIVGEGIGPEILEERAGRDAIVREVEADIFMSLESAETFHQWLGSKIDMLKNLKMKDAMDATQP